MTRPAAVALSLLLAGCFVSPAGETVLLTVAVDGPVSQSFAQSYWPWDSQDRFHLTTFPKHVRVALEPDGQDDEVAVGTWPDPQLGIGAGEGAGGEVDVSLEAPPGRYRLRVLGFVAEQGRVLVYGEEQPTTLSVQPGSALELTVDTRRLPTGRVALSVRCQQGNVAAWVPDRVMLWDVRAAVLMPPHVLQQTSVGSLEAEVPSVPVGREFWTRIILKHNITGGETAVEVRKLFQVEQPDERVPVSLVIPCTF